MTTACPKPNAALTGIGSGRHPKYRFYASVLSDALA